MHKYWAFMNWFDSEKVLNNIQNFFTPLIGWLLLALFCGIIGDEIGKFRDRRVKKKRLKKQREEKIWNP